jgi:AraC-like DNA-binding protein
LHLVGVVWKELLAGTFSVFERLLLLSQCRQNTGSYYNAQLRKLMTQADVDAALRTAHRLVWIDWLGGTPQQQESDLLSHLHRYPGLLDAIDALGWQEGSPFSALVPNNATLQDRNSFAARLSSLLFVSPQVNPLSNYWIRKTSQPDVLILRAVHLVKMRYVDPALTLSSLSNDLNISGRQLSREFYRQTGAKFQTFLKQLRMQEAQKLLATSSDSVKVVAWMVGYRYPSHFIRHFREVTSRTPRQFQKSIRGD